MVWQSAFMVCQLSADIPVSESFPNCIPRYPIILHYSLACISYVFPVSLSKMMLLVSYRAFILLIFRFLVENLCVSYCIVSHFRPFPVPKSVPFPISLTFPVQNSFPSPISWSISRQFPARLKKIGLVHPYALKI